MSLNAVNNNFYWLCENCQKEFVITTLLDVIYHEQMCHKIIDNNNDFILYFIAARGSRAGRRAGRRQDKSDESPGREAHL